MCINSQFSFRILCIWEVYFLSSICCHWLCSHCHFKQSCWVSCCFVSVSEEWDNLQRFYQGHLGQDTDRMRGFNVKFQVTCLFWDDSVVWLGRTARGVREVACHQNLFDAADWAKVSLQASQMCSVIILSEALKYKSLAHECYWSNQSFLVLATTDF